MNDWKRWDNLMLMMSATLRDIIKKHFRYPQKLRRYLNGLSAQAGAWLSESLTKISLRMTGR
jgi:hypothetical protein